MNQVGPRTVMLESGAKAIQWQNHSDHPKVGRPMMWAGDYGCDVCGQVRSAHGILFERKEARVCPGDWIITSPSGKWSFVVQDDYFEAAFLGNEKVGNAGLDKAEAEIAGTPPLKFPEWNMGQPLKEPPFAGAPIQGTGIKSAYGLEAHKLNAEIQRWSAELVKSEGECAELKQRLGCSQKENTALRQRLDKREDTLKEITEACNDMEVKISRLEARQNTDRGFEQLSDVTERMLQQSADVKQIGESDRDYIQRIARSELIEIRRIRRVVEQIAQRLAGK